MFLDKVVVFSGQLLMESLKSLMICHQLVQAAASFITSPTNLNEIEKSCKFQECNKIRMIISHETQTTFLL